jgi:hypothetical protein
LEGHLKWPFLSAQDATMRAVTVRLQNHRKTRDFAISTVWRRKRILPMLGRKTTADYGMGLAPIFFSEIFALS